MIIDFHTHIFPRAIRESRDNYFPEESAFELLYRSPKSKLIGADEIIQMMDEQGVDKSVVFGFPWHSSNIFKRNNDYVAEAVQRYPDRLIGFCCFDSTAADAPQEAERCLAGGLSGVGELAFYENGIDEAARDTLTPIMDICRERNLPIMLHTNEPVGHEYPGKSPNTLGQIYAFIKKFQRNRIILAHWGGGLFFYGLLKKEVKECLARVYFDTAATPYLYDSDVYAVATKILGPEKVLFGSDYPLLKPGRYFTDIAQTGLSGDEIKKIKGENAERLLKTCGIL
jgi:uncharacterized protein